MLKKIIKHVNIQLMILDPLRKDMSPKDFKDYVKTYES